MRQIVPHLWFPEKAEEACRFYVSVLPNSKIDHVTIMPAESPGGPEGSVTVVEFTLIGQPYMAIEAGPLDPFNHAVSFLIPCETQAEIDKLWAELVKDGGSYEECGWLRDRYGVAWQITPAKMEEWMRDPDRARPPSRRGDAQDEEARHCRARTRLRRLGGGLEQLGINLRTWILNDAFGVVRMTDVSRAAILRAAR